MTKPFDILLLGSGGREHALAWKIDQSPKCGRLYAAPGNPGIAEHAELVPNLDPENPEAVARFAKDNAIDLVVIGPEAPLAAGVADAVRAAGISAFGPGKEAAQLEASKAFTKELCAEANIPTAAWERFDALEPALAYAKAHPLPVVVKADGLAAGKGVTVAQTHAEAEQALRDLFAEPNAEVVIEAFLDGEEVSFFLLSDGKTAVPLLSAQDHKAVGEGDTGPNTGGMGAYAPARVFTPELQEQTMRTIVEPTLATMAKRGTPYSGVLFVGLILAKEGPQLLEYNARFGDPECQTLMMLLDSDIVELLHASATGELANVTPRWKGEVAAVVVMAAKGYPGTPAKHGAIRGLEQAAETGANIFQAGTTKLADGTLAASGGRVLAVTATGKTVREATGLCYQTIDKIDFADGFCRRDIGWREIAREEQG